jgi:hypothetical protein
MLSWPPFNSVSKPRPTEAGIWIVSTHPARLFRRNRTATALTLAERIVVGYGDDDPFVICWREELFL